MIRSRATLVVIHYRTKSEPSQHYSPTSASKGEEVGKRPILAAPFDPTTRLTLRSSHVSAPSENRAAHPTAIYSQTRLTDRLTISCCIASADIFGSRICQNPRYLSKVERRTSSATTLIRE